MSIPALPSACGVERMTMNRFAISDLRLIFENDVRFLSAVLRKGVELRYEYFKKMAE